jgi:hypothetical protein
LIKGQLIASKSAITFCEIQLQSLLLTSFESHQLTETPNYVDVHPIGTLTDATSKKLLNFAAILSLPGITGARPTQACYWRVERFKLLVGRDLGPTICRREKWKTKPKGARMGGRKSEHKCRSGQE